jgi:hypothetical protein
MQRRDGIELRRGTHAMAGRDARLKAAGHARNGIYVLGQPTLEAIDKVITRIKSA